MSARRRPRGNELSVEEQIVQVRTLSVGELHDKYVALFGEESRSRNREYLWKRLAYRIQELTEGGVSEDTRQKALELAKGVILKATPRGFQQQSGRARKPAKRDPRLPHVGTVLQTSRG